MVPSVPENCERELCLSLSGSAHLVNFTSSNKQLPSVKSVFKYFDHVSNLYEIFILIIFL